MTIPSLLAAQWSRIDARLLRFVLVGGLNTVVGYGMFAMSLRLTDAPVASLIAATFIAIFFNFVTTGRLVFGVGHLSRLLPFAAGYAVSLTLNIVLFKLLEYAGVGPLLDQALCLPVTVMVSYLINARLVFRALGVQTGRP